MEILLNWWLLLVIATSINVMAQSEGHLAISGVVLDKETGEPLAYASIGVANQGLGTITNDIGQFLLKVPARFRNDTIIVSYLGYARYKDVISKLGNQENLRITLASVPTILKEIAIQAERLNAGQIIEKAIAAIKENYPTDAFILEGFFREIQKQDEDYVELTEAAIKIFDKNFQRKLNHGITEEVLILEARKSINYADPIIQRVRKQNAIMDLLDNNPVHYPRGLLNTKYYSYQIDSVFQSQDDMIYIISTIPGNHRIYVAESNYAIIKTVEEVREGNAYKRPEFNLSDSLKVSRMAYFMAVSEFQRYDGKMYLKYSSETDAFEVLERSSHKRKYLVESYKEFVVTNIVDKNVAPFDKRETYKFSEDIVGKAYNPVFWNNLSTIQLSPLHPQVQHSLEREISLKDQFFLRE
jgi:hypothetical protein